LLKEVETGRREDSRMRDKIKRTNGRRKERRKQDMLEAGNRHGRAREGAEEGRTRED
jgi:hypothetical protein